MEPQDSKRLQVLSRRELLRRAAYVPAAAPVLWMLAGCGAADDPLTCNGGLAESATQVRASLHYVDDSPHGKVKVCENCAFFRTQAGGGCGTCLVVQGPIHPDGYCDSWSVKA